MYMTIFYIIIFSIIAHKEKRFMLPIVAFVFLVLGYLLVRKTRVWGKKVIKIIIWLSIVGEIGIHLAYYIHHNLWVMTDYMLIKNQSLDSHPHSLYTMKRKDQKFTLADTTLISSGKNTIQIWYWLLTEKASFALKCFSKSKITSSGPSM